MPSVTVKWTKETYNVDLDPSQPVAAFKAQLLSLTGVPLDRQKLMCKHWKGVLRDDASLSELALPEGAAITLMGTAEVLAAPVQKTVFVEDLPPSALAAAGHVKPVGIQNLGNTCYMNSAVETLRFVPELKEALLEFRSKRKDEIMTAAIASAAAMAPAFAGGDTAAAAAAAAHMSASHADLNLAFAELLAKMDASTSPVMPAGFLNRLRGVYAQFAEQSRTGAYKQQDSEEFASALMTSMANELRAPTSSVPKLAHTADSAAPPNLIDTLFGVDLEVEMTCAESSAEAPVVQREHHRKLVCNIEGGAGKSVQINHLLEGLKYALTGDVEKRSDVLGRNAVWTRKSRISTLPKYLCVQMMRFFWKATPDSRDHEGVKCKMMRSVAFPGDNLDLYELCTPAVQSVLKVSRDKWSAEHAPKKSDAVAAAAAPAEDKMDEDLPSGSAAASAAAAATEIGHYLPPNFRGLYELYALVTHKGRSADSGHYVGWARQRGDEWLVFDDDVVEEVNTEYVVERLKGGGDDHMAYLLFYRAKA